MSRFEIGIARCDLTPPLGTPLFGYPTERSATEVADNLYATALVLRSENTLAAIVSLDLCVIDEDEVAAVREAVAARTGIEPQNITLCATHTHSGPTTVTCWGWGAKDTGYLTEARAKIAAAVAAAQSALQPVRIGIGVGQSDIGINRREVTEEGNVKLGFYEWGPRDRDLTVVRFEGASGPVAQLVHVGAHPTSRGGDATISRDWPGVMVDRIDTLTGVPTIFINGAFGDVAPRTAKGGVVGDGGIAATEVGLRAAGDAIAVWRSIKEYSDVDLEVLGADFELPFAPLPPEDEANREAAARAGQEDMRGEAGCLCRYWSAVHEAHQSTPRTGRTWAQSITRFGPVVLVPFAGEIFADIALRLKKHSPYAFTICAGTSNGSHGYYVTREARGRGGYEVWVGRAYGAYLLADNIDDVLVTENLKLLRQMAAGANADAANHGTSMSAMST